MSGRLRDDSGVLLVESSLTVENVQKEDSGIYQCVVGVNEEFGGVGAGSRISEIQASAELRLGGESQASCQLD